MPRSETTKAKFAARREERRQDLLRAAADAIRKIGPRVSMDEIAAAAGITKPILYRHFGDRAGVAAALAAEYRTRLAQALARKAQRVEGTQNLLRGFVEGYVQIVAADPEVYRFITHEAAFRRLEVGAPRGARFGVLGQAFADILYPALAKRGLGKKAGPWGQVIAGSIQGSLNWWLEDRGISAAELIEHIVDLVWNGVASSLGERPGPSRAPKRRTR